MKIGEIAILSHNAQQKDDFICSICKKIDLKNELVSFGRFYANDQLALHLYGVSIDAHQSSLSWDLMSRKMLGYVIIFDWDDKISLESIKPIIDSFEQMILAPFIILANIQDSDNPPIPATFFKHKGIVLSPNFRLTFGQANKPESARRAIRLMIDMLLERVNHI
ncbi:MAG: hypothetical protein SCK70_07985 [bacterium]|nr:hypothetical protein [bacterium]